MFQKYTPEIEVNRSLTDIVSGNYIKGYGYAYALDESYRSDLPSRWTTAGKSEEEKRYENLTAKYVTNPNTIANSFDGRVASSTKEGLELSASVYGVGKALQGAKAINGVMSNSTKLVLGVSSISSVGSQLLTEGKVDPKTLAIDITTAYVTKGKGFWVTTGASAASGAFNGYVTDKPMIDGAISSGVGAAIGYGVGKITQVPLDKKINPNWKSYATESLNDKLPYIEVYRRSLIPSLTGTTVGEIGNRSYQYKMQENNK